MFYSTKANAKRAIKQKNLDATVVEVADKWKIVIQSKKSVAQLVGYNPQLLLGMKKTKTQSTVVNPVKTVWAIADANWGKKRKEIIQLCVDAGIAYNTARTQYQAFYQLKRLDGKN